MKNVFLYIFVLISCYYSKAQIWVQPNATWHFDFSNVTTGGFIKIAHIKDTILDSQTAKMFLSTKYEFAYDQNNVIYLLDSSIIDSNYTWNNSDTVFYWNNNQFEILYDFTRTIGDSWRIGIGGNLFNECSDTSTVKVLNEGLINLGGIDYTMFDLFSDDSTAYKLRGRYNARFGPYLETQGEYNFIFPNMSWSCDPSFPDESPLLTFKCFQDDGLIYNPSGEDCEFLLNNVGISELSKSNSKIYPNPNNGEIMIETTNEVSDLYIYNSLGVLCKTYTLNGKMNKIQLNVEKGIYIFQIKNNNEIKSINRITFN